MSNLAVTILDSRGERRDLEVPGDVPVSILGPAIAKAIRHPYLPQEDRQVKVVLKLEGSDQVIPLDKGLEAAGIAHGDVLQLMVKAIPERLVDSDLNLGFTGPGFAHPSGRTFTFRGDNILIGRVDRASGIVSRVLGVDLTTLEEIEEPSVSRRHAQVLLRGGEYLLQDLNSTNGTTVNGRLLAPEMRCPLEHGDEVQFGDITLFFLWDSQERDPSGVDKTTERGDLE
jgi:hypothetical protein